MLVSNLEMTGEDRDNFWVLARGRNLTGQVTGQKNRTESTGESGCDPYGGILEELLEWRDTVVATAKSRE